MVLGRVQALARNSIWTAVVALAILPSAFAQTYHVIHSFSGLADGSTPTATLAIDGAGNLYGTTSYGGARLGFDGSGIVFKLSEKNSSWILSPLYTFHAGSDGAYPGAPVVIGPNGSLYGTTSLAGLPGCNGLGCGLVYRLHPPLTICHSVLCPWTQVVLYRFSGGSDGAHPAYGPLTFDQAGNIYGTTGAGGDVGNGVVYELTTSGGGWQQKVLHSFAAMADGRDPESGVVLDPQGNLYGTTVYGGAFGDGTVYELTPSGSVWLLSNLYDVGNQQGSSPYAGLVFDQQANLYGASLSGGGGNSGTIFQIATSGGQWSPSLLYTFPPAQGGSGLGVFSNLTLDAVGNLYGTTETDGAHGFGSVFKLTHQNGSWTQTTLYDFTGGTDGCNPGGGVTLGANGRLYGTTEGCGTGYGVVWEITP